MKAYAILSASGPDRAGIVYDVSKFLFVHNCNLEDSRMAVLGGQFALIALFCGEAPDVARLRADLPAFEQASALRAMVFDAANPAAASHPPALPVRLEVVAMDAPGILARLSEILKRFGVNIETLDAHLAPAPLSGTTVSSIKMKLLVPQEVQLKTVKEALSELADEINLDLLFQPVQE